MDHSESDGDDAVAAGQCAFGNLIRLEPGVARRIDAGLDAIAASLAQKTSVAPLASSVAEALGLIRSELSSQSTGGKEDVVLSHSVALDLAAGFLDLADLLFEAGLPLEALAIEGVEAHVLEALVAPSFPVSGTGLASGSS